MSRCQIAAAYNVSEHIREVLEQLNQTTQQYNRMKQPRGKQRSWHNLLDNAVKSNAMGDWVSYS